MTETVSMRNAVDTFVGPNKRGSFGDSQLGVNVNARAYTYFALPILGTGAVIVSATLTVLPHSIDNPQIVNTMTLKKLNSSLDPNSLVWNSNEPAVGSVVDVENHSRNAAWKFDVTDHINAVYSGESWYGWQLTSDIDDTSYTIDSSRGGGSSMILDIEYSVAPPTPSNLEPRNGVELSTPKPILSWLFQGYTANSFPVAFQVMLDTSPSFSNAFNSGEVASESSNYYLRDSSFDGLVLNTKYYWKVRVKNDSGIWSDWSTVAEMKYTGENQLDITSPGATTNDPTPVIEWSMEAPQQAFRIQVRERNTTSNTWQRIYDSGLIASTAESFELPPGVITKPNLDYQVMLDAWTTANVTVLPGSRNNFSDLITVRWVPSGALPAIDLDVLGEGPTPSKLIQWKYTGPFNAIKSFVVTRKSSTGAKDKVFIVDPGQAKNTTQYMYSFVDRLIPGRADVTWEVAVVTTAGSSENNPTITKSIRNPFPWVISTVDPNKAFSMVNADIDPGLSEVSDVVVPVYGQPYLVQQSLQGFVGSASGLISHSVATDELTGQQMFDNFLWIRENPSVYFVWQDQAIEAFIYNCAFVPIGRPDGRTDHTVSFNFVEL